jgi:NAD(P)-dependent dehydrogenase (short-subunit alcohol dehydrogenase family)
MSDGKMSDQQRAQPVPGIDGSMVVVTGGNHGIGRAIALAFARAGANVALSSRSRDSLEAVAAEITALGRRALAVTCDVSDERSVEEMGARVLEAFPRVDHVVANAGIVGPTRPLHEITYAEWRDASASTSTASISPSDASCRACSDRVGGASPRSPR